MGGIGARCFLSKWKHDFLSDSREKGAVKDYWVPTIVGTAELAIYPALITLAAWHAVGGWIAIKTAMEWRFRGVQGAYTRFILGNALVIFTAFLLASMIKP